MHWNYRKASQTFLIIFLKAVYKIPSLETESLLFFLRWGNIAKPKKENTDEFFEQCNNRWWNLEMHNFDLLFKFAQSIRNGNTLIPKKIRQTKSVGKNQIDYCLVSWRYNLSLYCAFNNYCEWWILNFSLEILGQHTSRENVMNSSRELYITSQ